MSDPATGDGASTTEAIGQADTGTAGNQQPVAAATTAAKPADQADTKQAESKPPEDEAKPGDKPADKAPEITYDIKVEVPEGVEVDTAGVEALKEVAKAHNLSQDAAQALAKLAADREVARREAFTQQVKTWGDEVAADKELGTKENQALARKAVEKFGSPALKAALEHSGLGNHPELVRMMLKVGRAISEDSFVPSGREGNGAPKSLEQRLYPNQA